MASSGALMMEFDPYAYSITVCRIDIDGERLFRASVLELPDVDAYESTYKKAYDLVIDAIEGLYALALEDGQAFPNPIGFKGGKSK